MGAYVIEEAERCLNCKNPRCQQGCPIHTDIPEVIELFKDNKTMEAAEILFENNPLSIICSIVCNHEKQCEGHCVRGIKGSPVHFSEIERYISDSCFERIKIKQAESNGKKVAVIGAGPAGITIAIILASRGYKVTIFEMHDKIGGILRYGIPEFRLPKSILDRYLIKMRELGIMIRPSFALGGSTGISDLLKDGYKSVFVGTGAWKPYKLGIPGETFGNVCYAINYLNNPEGYVLGRSVAVIGAGNSAMDVARTAIRHGVEEVIVYVRGNKVAASGKEYDYAILDGVRFEFNKVCTRITDNSIIVADTVNDEDGKLKMVEGSEKEIEKDFVIISISQQPHDRLVKKDSKLMLNDNGNLQTDAQGETTMEGVFAAGDVATGTKTVVAAVAGAKRIADDMDRYMRTLH
ncbi:MAG: NAD(P)-dependent oxidoreductase [Eubacterium sp.]|nr:NAD(P)-dependent oxidoreductase [Eubacterium sp.]